MSGFAPDWLALREPADAEARAPGPVDALRGRLDPARPLRILDLGTGTGANPRYLAPLLGGRQAWLLADDDAAVLAALPGTMGAWAEAVGLEAVRKPAGVLVRGADFSAEMTIRRIDLAARVDELPIGCPGLVTASALLDLVSAAWLDALARRCVRTGAAALFALTYDGRMGFEPAEPEDGEVTDLVNRHQRTDKGFGPALGPDAITAATTRFAALGYAVRTWPSAWRLGLERAALQRALILGWTGAAEETAPKASARIDDWCRRRLAHVEAGRSRLLVGHQDLLAVPLHDAGVTPRD